MSSKLKEMIGNLNELEEFCGRLVRLTMSEREALIQTDLQQLTKTAKSKNDLSGKIKALRDKTRLLTQEMAPEGAGVRTIDQLLPYLPEESRQSLSGPYSSYRGKARELRLYNTHNMILAKYGLKSIEGRVAEIVGAVQGLNATYKPPGQTAGQGHSRLGRVHRRA